MFCDQVCGRMSESGGMDESETIGATALREMQSCAPARHRARDLRESKAQAETGIGVWKLDVGNWKLGMNPTSTFQRLTSNFQEDLWLVLQASIYRDRNG